MVEKLWLIMTLSTESSVKASGTPSADTSEAAIIAGDVVVKPASSVQSVLVVLGIVAFLYVAHVVVLPIVMAAVMATTLKPLMRWLSKVHVPLQLSAALVLGFLMVAVGFGFFQLGRPAMLWLNEAPQHISEVRQRIQKMFPPLARFSRAANAVNNLGATDPENHVVPTVAVKDGHTTTLFINWTGTFLAGLGETIVLLYLLLASGDLFLQKIVHLMPTLSDKKRAVEISHTIQQNISNYLFTVSIINVCLGTVVSLGLYFLKVPNAPMWGMFVALLNFVPYFGPIVGVLLLAVVGVLTFDAPWQGLLPPAWYLTLHLLEANFITPILLGRRFTLNPVVIFISLMFWLWLWGVLGALLAVPILVSLKVICDFHPALAPASELLSSDHEVKAPAAAREAEKTPVK